MAEDSAAPAPTPQSPSPTPTRAARLTAWVVVVGTVVAGGGLIAAADVQPTNEPRTRAETFLPADGYASELTYDTNDPDDDGKQWILESAYGTGAGMMLLLPGIAGDHQLARLEGRVETTRLWRQTWTDVSGERGQLMEIYELAEDGVRLMTLTGGENGFSFDPGLLVLPAGVAPGSTWASEGDALPGSIATYRSTGLARDAGEGCLEVELTTTYFDPAADNAVLLDTVDTSTWCPGRGVVESSYVTGDAIGSTEVAALEPRRSFAGDTDVFVPDLSGVDDLEPESVSFVDRDPLFPESIFTAATDGTIAVTPSGIAAVLVGSDVIGYRLDAEPASDAAGAPGAERAWIAHPGGRVTELSAIGDAVLVATTERVLHLYDAQGRRAWTAAFDDVIMESIVPAGARRALAMTLDGELRMLSLGTGRTIWSQNLGDAPVGAPVVVDGIAYVGTRDDRIHAIDVTDGTTVWSEAADGVQHLAVGDGLVVVATEGLSLLTFAADDGAHGWSVGLSGLPLSITAAGELFVVVTLDGTIAFDGDGTAVWARSEGQDVLTDGERVALLDIADVVLLDASGEELSRWETPPITSGIDRQVVAVPGGFWLFGSDFTALEWRADG